MAFPGELKGFDGVTCDCGKRLPLRIAYSPAGYYLGYFCGHCGPYSRETGYFKTRSEAETQLKIAKQGGIPLGARDTGHHP